MGMVPNAFDLMMSSDFSIDYIGANPMMFSQDALTSALSPAITAEEQQPSLKKTQLLKLQK